MFDNLHVSRGFVTRDFNRTEEDDFKLNVQPKLERSPGLEAVPQYALVDPNIDPEAEPRQLKILGWKIQSQFE